MNKFWVYTEFKRFKELLWNWAGKCGSMKNVWTVSHFSGYFIFEYHLIHEKLLVGNMKILKVISLSWWIHLQREDSTYQHQRQYSFLKSVLCNHSFSYQMFKDNFSWIAMTTQKSCTLLNKREWLHCCKRFWILISF